MQGNFPFEQFLINNSNNLKESQDHTQKQVTTIENSSGTLSSTFSPQELKFMNDEILNQLKSNVNPQKYEAFFSHTFKLAQISDNKATFAVKRFIHGHALLGH